MDLSLDKRVELHLHTVMSDMDSVVDIGRVISTAKGLGTQGRGHHGPWGPSGLSDCSPLSSSKDDPFKIIYGVEGYFVNDRKKLVTGDKGQTLSMMIMWFLTWRPPDFSPDNDAIIEIGAVKIIRGKIVDRFSVFLWILKGLFR